MNASPTFDPPRPDSVDDLATYLQQMREQERGDLARELHDELGSLLTGAKLEVATLKLRLDGASTEVLQRLRHLAEIINNGIQFSRRLVESLYPSSLANLGLRASLELLTRDFELSSGVSTITELDDVQLDAATQLTVYRVVQESLNNACKHAHATGAQVRVIDRGASVSVTIRDNGVGFETAAVAPSSHGLAGMQHRVGACGGQLTVDSAPGSGTLLVAVLPKESSAGACPQRGVSEAAEATMDNLSSANLQRLMAARELALAQPVSGCAPLATPMSEQQPIAVATGALPLRIQPGAAQTRPTTCLRGGNTASRIGVAKSSLRQAGTCADDRG